MPLFDENLLKKYVRLAVRRGVNIQPGQKLVINCPVDCAFFARLAQKEAYEAGASQVFIRWGDDICLRVRYLMAPEETFDYFPPWDQLMLNSLAGEGAAFLSVSAADPELFKGVDPNRLTRAQKASSAALREYRDCTMGSHVQWCVVSVPTTAWADKVFPGQSSGDAAVAMLWQKIFSACRIDTGDPIENWESHSRDISSRANRLNAAQFEFLHIKNSAGTDLRLRLPKNHVWAGGGESTSSGVPILPNIPTEELFTAPHMGGVDGVVVSSRPTVYFGDVIENFSITFKDGKVISFTADKNRELLERLITDIPGMDRLGEVALVPHTSPISQTGILFYNTLFDENASCHLALGRAYPDCVSGGSNLSSEELLSAGLNFSDGHHDFMFGTADLSVTGITPAGENVPVFENGVFSNSI